MKLSERHAFWAFLAAYFFVARAINQNHKIESFVMNQSTATKNFPQN